MGRDEWTVATCLPPLSTTVVAWRQRSWPLFPSPLDGVDGGSTVRCLLSLPSPTIPTVHRPMVSTGPVACLLRATAVPPCHVRVCHPEHGPTGRVVSCHLMGPHSRPNTTHQLCRAGLAQKLTCRTVIGSGHASQAVG